VPVHGRQLNLRPLMVELPPVAGVRVVTLTPVTVQSGRRARCVVRVRNVGDTGRVWVGGTVGTGLPGSFRYLYKLEEALTGIRNPERYLREDESVLVTFISAPLYASTGPLLNVFWYCGVFDGSTWRKYYDAVIHENAIYVAGYAY